MTWVKLDDGFFAHPKALAAGKDGRALFIAGLCHSAAYLTDGHIASSVLPLIAAAAEVRGPSTARRLVDVGLWEAVADGWIVPGWGDYQPSAEKVRAERAAARERKAKQRARGAKTSGRDATTGQYVTPESRQSHAVTNSGVTQGVTRYPSPSPSTEGCTDAAAGTAVAAANGQTPDQVLAAAVDLALDQLGHRTRAASKTNPTGWLRSAAAGVRADLIAADAWARIAQGATPADLVALIEPAVEPERPRATPLDSTQQAQRALADRNRRTLDGDPDCPRCLDRGVHELDDGTFAVCDHTPQAVAS